MASYQENALRCDFSISSKGFICKGGCPEAAALHSGRQAALHMKGASTGATGSAGAHHELDLAD